TTLSELERARLAMKPAPPSIPPRPADIPAEPRPAPPPIQGRIDAVNALAQCVAIGDPEPPPPAPVVVPRARTRAMPPVSPSGIPQDRPTARRSSPALSPSEGGVGVAPATASVRPSPPVTPTETGLGIAPKPVLSRASTAPLPMPPTPVPRATPQ